MSAIHRTKEWARFTRKVRPTIAAALPSPCVECGRAVMPGQRFDVAHIISHARDPFQPLSPELVGPAHPSCNRSAGAKENRARQLQRKRDADRLPSADSGWLA